MPNRILVADKMKAGAFDDLAATGVEIVVRPELTADTMPDALEGVRVLVVRSTIVTAKAIEAAKDLALIVRAGSGTNNIDVEAASARGIYVSNCPGKNSVAVAELAMGLILALDRRIADNVIDLRAGRWNKAEYSKARGLKGQRLGLVGFGNIAREVARRARAFDMEVLAYSRTLGEEDAARAKVTRAASLQQLFRASDVVSLHVPLSKDTRGLIGRELLGLLRDRAMVINTSRAEVVDDEALREAVEAKKIRVGTDVFAAEPEGKDGAFADPLGAFANVYGTHHIGASTDQAQNEIADAAIDIVKTFFRTGEIKNAVNILLTPSIQGTLVIRHLDRVGVLASVLQTLREDDINVETMENVVFEGSKAACARIRVAQRPSGNLVERLGALEHVIGVELM